MLVKKGFGRLAVDSNNNKDPISQDNEEVASYNEEQLTNEEIEDLNC